MYTDDIRFLLENSPIAIAPCLDGMHSSIIYAHEGDFYSKIKVSKLLDLYCLKYGSSLEGRLSASRKILGIIKNPPICISSSGIIGIQLPCQFGKGIVWVIDLGFTIEQKHRKKSVLVFDNNFEITVYLSSDAIRIRKARAIEVLHAFT